MLTTDSQRAFPKRGTVLGSRHIQILQGKGDKRNRKRKKSFCISPAVFKQNNNLKYQGKKQVEETEFKIVPFPQSRGGERGFPDPQIKQLTTLTTTCYYVLPSLRSTGFLKTRACQTEVEDEESRSPLSSKKSTQLKQFFF